MFTHCSAGKFWVGGRKELSLSCPPHPETLRQSTARSIGFPWGRVVCFSAHLTPSKPCVFCPVKIVLATAGENPCALGAGCARVWS